jgi:predicted Rossmann fold nucleotide-binding protein DprA/Smf involved in DNA uptake
VKIAVVGSRTLNINISDYLPSDATGLVSGGAKGIDTLAEAWADSMNIPKLIIKPEYHKYGKAAPIKRNETIVAFSDIIIAIWDGKSRGTKYVIEYAKRLGKPIKVYIIE